VVVLLIEAQGEIRKKRPQTWSGFTTYDRDRSRSPSSSRSQSTIPHDRDVADRRTTNNESDTSYPTYRYSSYTPSMFTRSSEILTPWRPTPTPSFPPNESPSSPTSSPPSSRTSSPPPYRPSLKSKKPPQECQCPIKRCTCSFRHGEIDHRELVPRVQYPHTKGADGSVTV
jgi:hypothetical protein